MAEQQLSIVEPVIEDAFIALESFANERFPQEQGFASIKLLDLRRHEPCEGAIFIGGGRGEECNYAPGVYFYLDEQNYYGSGNAVPWDRRITSAQDLERILTLDEDRKLFIGRARSIVKF